MVVEVVDDTLAPRWSTHLEEEPGGGGGAGVELVHLGQVELCRRNLLSRKPMVYGPTSGPYETCCRCRWWWILDAGSAGSMDHPQLSWWKQVDFITKLNPNFGGGSPNCRSLWWWSGGGCRVHLVPGINLVEWWTTGGGGKGIGSKYPFVDNFYGTGTINTWWWWWRLF